MIPDLREQVEHIDVEVIRIINQDCSRNTYDERPDREEDKTGGISIFIRIGERDVAEHRRSEA